MKKNCKKIEKEIYLPKGKGMELVGERIMSAANKIAQTVSAQVEIGKLAASREYIDFLKNQVIKPTVIQYAKEEKLVVQAYFHISHDMTPLLGPDEEAAGVSLVNVGKKGEFYSHELSHIREYYPENEYMKWWYYKPIASGAGVWSKVYFDAHINMDVISYSIPVYVEGVLLGVTGLDLDYNDFRSLMNERLMENIEDSIELIRKEHEALGEGKSFSEQYISMDTLQFVGKEDMFSGIVTRSKEMEPVMELAIKASMSNANILILGETGVGKDFLASYIHSKSTVRNGPFVNVNCSAIPESLLESEFFGYGKGAFTGAKDDGKPGFFEAANGGTIFLNEMGELPIHLQVKFLNVIQQKAITKIGETTQRKVDFRLITATNRNLLELVSQGRFREDLYYRLNVISIYIPPLRDRKDDIVSLLNYYLFKNMEKYNIKRRFSPELLDILINYSWPGNIRELENLVERLAITSNDYIIDQNVLPQDFINKTNRYDIEKKDICNSSLKDMVKEFEASIIRLKYTEFGSSRKVAKALGISQSQANEKIKEYRIKD